MERRAVPGELSGQRGVATLVRSFAVAVAFSFIVQVYDPNGVLVATGCAEVAGTRFEL
jgi:hypothetical protein